MNYPTDTGLISAAFERKIGVPIDRTEARTGWAAPIGAYAAAFAPVVGVRTTRPAHGWIKVVVFNARSGARFGGILRCLRQPPLADADLILLCEADWRLRRSGRREFASELAAAMGMNFVFVPEFGRMRTLGPPTAFTGNAILSSVPLSDIRIITMPSFRLRWRRTAMVGEQRAIAATADFHGHQLTVAVAHLNSRTDPVGRSRQMAALIAGLPRTGPAVIGGDWNTTTVGLSERRDLALLVSKMIVQPRRLRYPQRYEPLFDQIAQAGFAVNGANIPGKPTFTFTRAIAPILRPKLDWIAYRGMTPIANSARVVAPRTSLISQRLSDHDFVMCDFVPL